MSGNQSITFSAREMEVLALAWQCMKQQPDIDMDKLAQLAGYTRKSAPVIFGNIKRKLKNLGEGLAADGPKTPKKPAGPARGKAGSGATPKSTGKRGASKACDGEDEETPSKRSKKGGKGRRGEDGDDDDDDEEIMVKVKREEVADITNGALDFYAQLSDAAKE